MSSYVPLTVSGKSGTAARIFVARRKLKAMYNGDKFHQFLPSKITREIATCYDVRLHDSRDIHCRASKSLSDATATNAAIDTQDNLHTHGSTWPITDRRNLVFWPRDGKRFQQPASPTLIKFDCRHQSSKSKYAVLYYFNN
jgi:hypothetical protein